MVQITSSNLILVSRALDALGELAEEVVLVGGAATALLINDQASPGVRPTMDVDVVVEVSSRAENYRFGERLRAKGFMESGIDGVICRWVKGRIILDVMPVSADILGFTNRWYVHALRHAARTELGGRSFWSITAPYFLGTKFEAFHGRGGGDALASHDVEDIVAVIDGRPEIVAEIIAAEADITEYLAAQARLLLAWDVDEYVITGHLPPDPASQRRSPIVRERLAKIASLP